MAKKRNQTAAGLATASEGHKKRKAATQAAAKTKRIAEDEFEASEDEEFEELSTSHLEGGSSKGKRARRDRVEDMPLVAPGLRLWEGFAKTVPGTDLGMLTEANVARDQSLKYGFTLQPLIVTEGPLAGKKVLVLQENAPFRFMDLPPEIRNIVYRHMLDEDNEIEIRSYKPAHQTRRPICRSFPIGSYRSNGNLKWDKVKGKWIGQEPSSHALLAVCKQMLQETATIAYGSNTFEFEKWSEAKLFFQTIGSMKNFLRQCKLPHEVCSFSTARSVFKQLQDATDLRKMIMSHETVCRRPRANLGFYTVPKITPACWAMAMGPLFKAWKKSDKTARAHGESSGRDLFDIIKIVPRWSNDKCYYCGKGQSGLCTQLTSHCKVKCEDLAAHFLELAEEIRATLKKELEE